jgi:ferredoxin
MPRVRVEPHGASFEAPAGATLLDAALDQGLPMPFGCQSARCGLCCVAVREGSSGLAPPSRLEAAVLEGLRCPPGARLACQARLEGDVTVEPLALAGGAGGGLE